MSFALGIDLGTTYTAAAIVRDNRAEMVPLGNRGSSVPSLVFLRDDGMILTGDAAERRGLVEPARLARQFKRRVGDSTPIVIGNSPYSAERLMAALLRRVVEEVQEREGGVAGAVALSHPANWGPYKIDLIRQAAELAGLRGAALTTEPVAAAVHYASSERIEVGETVAVYDLGGGTFDAAVLRRTAEGFEPLGRPEGIERLGGIDFDEAVFSHVRRSLDGALETLDIEDSGVRAGLARLRDECTRAKESLSDDSDTTIPVVLPGLQVDLRLTRTEFETMIRPPLEETIQALLRAMESASVQPDDLRAVLLVGGSSRIPVVADMVSSALGRPVAVDAHPKHAVALGVARIATSLLAAPAAVADAEPAEPAEVEPAEVEAVEPVEEPAVSAPAVAAASEVAVDPEPAPPVTAPEETDEPAPKPEPQPAATPAAAPRPEPTPQPVSAHAAPARTRSRASWIAGAVAAVVAAVAAGSFALATGSGGEEAASQPTSTSTSTPTTVGGGTPPCTSQSGRCAFITGIRIEGDRYIADYQPIGFSPRIHGEDPEATPDDRHVHFFFDTTAPQNAGTNGQPPGAWQIWDLRRGGGRPVFDAFTPAQRGAASQLCVAVADHAHAVEADAAATGNCVRLPDA